MVRVDAIWRRIDIARKFVDDFGVAAECRFSPQPAASAAPCRRGGYGWFVPTQPKKTPIDA